MDDVCTDGKLAVKYGFSARDFSTFYYGFDKVLTPNTSPELDLKSIM